MKRRDFVVVVALGGNLLQSVGAQVRPVRIGILAPGPQGRGRSQLVPVFLRRLAELAYVEGKTVVFEERYAAGETAPLPRLAREMAKLTLDLIFAPGSLAGARALLDAGVKIPIILAAPVDDPVDARIVTSYARPGMNITGAFIPQGALAVKRLELLREMVPQASSVLVLSDAFSKGPLAAMVEAAERGRLKLEVVQFGSPPYDLDAAFEQGRKAGVQAVIGMESLIFFQNRARMSDLALKHRLAAVGASNEYARAGFVASYGADLGKLAERAAEIAVRVLKGANPAATPVEQVSEYDLAVNLTAAHALGLQIPPAVMVRATHVFR